MCPRKRNCPEAKGKDSKKDQAPVPAKDEAAKGEEATGGALEATPDNPEGIAGETVGEPDGELVGGFADQVEGEEAEETRDGFRAECYDRIDKGIDNKTKMVVVKLRHRLASGDNVFPGETFLAGEMDARVIAGNMERYYIMPANKAPKEGERRADYVSRMMAEYEPKAAVATCGKKK